LERQAELACRSALPLQFSRLLTLRARALSHSLALRARAQEGQLKARSCITCGRALLFFGRVALPSPLPLRDAAAL